MIPIDIVLPVAIADKQGVLNAHPTRQITLDLHRAPCVTMVDRGVAERLPALESTVAAAVSGVISNGITLALTLFDLKDGRCVFICSELSHNAGPSITNAWPHLGEALLREVGGVEPENAVFLEHYGPFSYASASSHEEETFDLVTIQWQNSRAINPSWKRLI